MDTLEQQRLASLRALGLLDTPAEERFDRITRLAQRTFSAPIVLISLIDEKRVWFKSRVGLAETEMPRDGSFCEETLACDGLMLVPDAAKDPRFASHPLVAGGPRIRFYAGQPLQAPDGRTVGALSLLDVVPRDLDLEQRRALRDLTGMVQEQLASAGPAGGSADEQSRMVARLRDTPGRRALRRNVRAGLLAAALIVLAVSGVSIFQTRRIVAEADSISAASPRGAEIALSVGRMTKAARFLRVAVVVRGVVALALLGFVFWLFLREDDARLAAEAAVELERARLKGVIDGIPDGVVAADTRGRLILFNHAAERIIGMGVVEADPAQFSRIYGVYLHDGVTPCPPESLPMGRALAGDSVRDVELVVRNAQRPGGVRVSASASMIRGADGAPAGAILVFRDIGERA
ncbi:MAG: PAS domain-containing protein [Elusimicrobia bacterium]|nr:PAS domain-containing protein [Elusimicrobiota bacterium]